jgi:regulator of sirC expression with transglutaminase-like and TPR domain
MTEQEREIAALIQLIDDPDNEVQETVVARLLHYGREIVPRLERVWEATADEGMQKKMEELIHRVHFNDLKTDAIRWNKAPEPDLLAGALLIARYSFPQLDVATFMTHFEKLRRDVWLEMNNYLTPLEQVNVMNSIVYSYYKLQGHELASNELKHYFINQVLESRQGNTYTIGILYLAICEALDIPIFAIDLPRQFIFAYIDTVHSFLNEDAGIQHIPFFIDPMNGMVYTQNDIDQYLKKLNAPVSGRYYRPLNNRQILAKMLKDMAKCYDSKGDTESRDDMQQLLLLMSKPPDDEE